MTRRFLLVVSLFAVALSGATAAESTKRAITHEDLWLLKRVGTPVASPDGKWAVVPVTQPAYDAKETASDLWLVALDGATPPRQLTQTKAPETGADWSPDATRIAFSSKRDGDDVAQVYVIDLAHGGEAERITSLSTGARGPLWSPDGKQLLFVSEVYPGAGDDEANKKAAKAVKDRKYNARAYEGFPIKYWDRWLDEKKAHLFVQDAKAGAKARDLLAGTQLAALPGFGGKEAETGENLPAAWTPDGQGVVFVARTTRNRAAYAETPTQLFQLALAGGEPKQLTDEKGSYDDPAFRPDGKGLLASYEAGGDGKTYHHQRIVAFPWPFEAAKRTVLTEKFDLSVVKFVAGDDSKTVYFTAEAGDQTKLFSVPVAGGAVKAHEVPKAGCLTGLGIGGGVLIANYDSAANPPEVARLEVAAGTYRALTHFNDAVVAKLDLPPVERFEFTSAKGRPIHNLLVKPAGFDAKKKYPLLVVMHGGPTPQFKDQWGLRWNYHLLASPGYVLVLTNYSGSTGYTEAFGQAIQFDPLKTPADEINQGADEAIKRYAFIDGSRQAAAGASYGGHLANWMEATTTRYKCIISHAGLVTHSTQWSTSDSIYHREVNNGGPVWEQNPIWREQSPTSYAGNHAKGTGWVTPILVTVGELDARVPINNSMENWTYLQRLQVPSKLLVFPDANHWITKGEDSRFWFGEVHAWLAKWLK
ncbi:MAG: S9 family peptidase [Verrucomicrobia bacterium]|nr:S9 family peptidase [Verrucomicrobiota bacterium]